MGHTERRSGRERRRKNKLIDIRNVYYFKVLFPPSHIPVQLWVSALLLPLLCLFFPSSTACLLCRVPSFDGDCTFMFLFQCFCCRFCFFFGTKSVVESANTSTGRRSMHKMKIAHQVHGWEEALNMSRVKLLKSSPFKLPFNGEKENEIYIFEQ